MVGKSGYERVSELTHAAAPYGAPLSHGGNAASNSIEIVWLYESADATGGDAVPVDGRRDSLRGLNFAGVVDRRTPWDRPLHG